MTVESELLDWMLAWISQISSIMQPSAFSGLSVLYLRRDGNRHSKHAVAPSSAVPAVVPSSSTPAAVAPLSAPETGAPSAAPVASALFPPGLDTDAAASPPRPRYQYAPLSGSRSIRVLEIYPVTDWEVEPFEGTLVEIDLDDSPEYEALSYTLEGQVPSAPIETGGGILHITPNCELAIRRLLRAGRKRRVWIDSICINQADVAEQSRQVQLMGEFYARAQRVDVWLGPATEDTDATMNLIWKVAMANLRATRVRIAIESSPTALRLVGDTIRDWTSQEHRRLYDMLTLGR